MSTVTKCTCGHEISQHTYSDDDTGCDVYGCNCMLDLGELIDKYAMEVADRTERNLKDMQRIAELENFIRTRNVVCTWCGFKVVYDNENEEEKQAARDAVNAHALICEKDPRTMRLRKVEDAALIAGNTLTDVKNYLETEIKVCSGVGMEYELGLVESIDAFQDLHGELVKELGEKYASSRGAL